MTQPTRKHSMTQIRLVASLGALLVATACKNLEVPDYNAQSITDLQQGAGPPAIATATVGLLGISRDFNTSFLSSWVVTVGEMGREGVELDPSNPIHPVDRLQRIGDITTGTAGWSIGYNLIRQANVLIKGLDAAVRMTH